MKTNFTTGPWFATTYPRSGAEPAFAVVRAIDTICGLRNAGDYTDEQIAANASLIASAPDLYTACEKAHAFLERFRDTRDAVDLRGELLAVLLRANGATPDPKTSADTARDLGLRKPAKKRGQRRRKS